jgi:hypothetical protein
MSDKGFRDCADAALRTEFDRRFWPDARKRVESIVDWRKAFGGKRALPACHALECSVDVNAEMDSTRDTAKPDDLDSDRECGQELGTLQWFSLLWQHR